MSTSLHYNILFRQSFFEAVKIQASLLSHLSDPSSPLSQIALIAENWLETDGRPSRPSEPMRNLLSELVILIKERKRETKSSVSYNTYTHIPYMHTQFVPKRLSLDLASQILNHANDDNIAYERA